MAARALSVHRYGSHIYRACARPSASLFRSATLSMCTHIHKEAKSAAGSDSPERGLPSPC